MGDQILSWAVVILPTLFALGIEVVSKEIKEHPYWRAAVLTFGLGLSVLTGLQIHRADKVHGGELDAQKQAVENLKAMIQTNEVRNASDMGYLKAKLEDARMHQSVPFDTKLFARTLIQRVQQGIEVLSDQKLANESILFGKQLRQLSASHGQQDMAAIMQQMQESQAAGAKPSATRSCVARMETKGRGTKSGV